MELLYWYALSEVSFLSLKEKYELITYFKEPEKIFKESVFYLESTGIIKKEKAIKLKRFIANPENYKYIENMGIKLCKISDINYPERLRNIYSPPVFLYYKGKLPEQNCIAMVGSRKCTLEGRRKAEVFAGFLADKNYCIVSGLARGIDSSSHRGALNTGTTAAILGCGINICYPPENRRLMEEIEKKGCIISEYPPYTKPSKYTFPARNRIIIGISKALVVVESAEKSGAMITVDFALDQGKDIYAFKPSEKYNMKGTSILIDEGAKEINSFKDFLMDFEGYK